MFRRTFAGAVLGPALLIGSLAWSGFVAMRTVFDADRSGDVAEELLDNEQVRAQLASNLADAIEATLPEGVPVDPVLVETAAVTVLNDPRVEMLILESFGATHRAFLGQGDAPEELDLTPVLEAARENVALVSPELAESLPATESFVIDLPTEHVPDASPVQRFLERVVPYLAAIAVVGVLIALVATTDRPQVLRRAGRWALGVTIFFLVLGLGVPWLLRQAAPDQTEVLAALLSALMRTTLVPAIALAALGAVMIVGAMVWPDTTRQAPAASAARTPAAVPTPNGGDRRRVDRRAPAPTAAPPAPAAPIPAAPMPPAVPPPAAPMPAAAPPVVPPPTVVHPPPAVTQPPPLPTSRPVAPPAPGDVPLPPVPARAPFPTREGAGAGTAPVPAVDATGPHRLPPRWVEGHGWVLDPADPRTPPDNARWVEGVGYVVPGPPPG